MCPLNSTNICDGEGRGYMSKVYYYKMAQINVELFSPFRFDFLDITKELSGISNATLCSDHNDLNLPVSICNT